MYSFDESYEWVPLEFESLSPTEGAAAVAGTTAWWDDNAQSYLEEHGHFLGDIGFRWCPEGLSEDEACLLGDIPALVSAGARFLEVGCGGAQCSRWLLQRGAHVIATDISAGMLAQAQELNERTGLNVPTQIADARELPFADESFEVVFTAFGAIPFVADSDRIHAEAFRVLTPGGIWVFSTSHPFRWVFPDDPTKRGLTAQRSYFDTRAYVERTEDGTISYAEHHRTLTTHFAELLGAGFVLETFLEPQWQAGNAIWGAWGPERGAFLPGTMLMRARKPR